MAIEVFPDANEILRSIPNELYSRYQIDGFSDEEIVQIWKDRAIMLELYYNGTEKEPREITSSTYIRSQKRLNRKVENWLGLN